MAELFHRHGKTSLGLPFLIFITSFLCGLGLVRSFEGDLAGASIVGQGIFENFKKPTFYRIIVTNLIVLGVILLGPVTFGTTSLVILIINGFIVGGVTGSLSAVEFMFAILPHGIFEFSGFILATAASLCVARDFILYLMGKSKIILAEQTKRDYVRASIASIILVIIGAVVEVTVTPLLLKMLLG